MKTGFIKYFFAAAAVLAISACATSSSAFMPTMGKTGSASSGGGGVKSGGAVKVSDSPLYFGIGSGSSLSSAMNTAKLNAVKHAASDALGKASSMANREVLEDKVYDIRCVS